MKRIGWATCIYGGIIIAGGWIGYAKAESLPSLVFGLLFGFLLLLSSWAIFRNKQLGAYVALLLTLLLDGFFTYRFLITQKLMPSGIMSLISLCTLLFLALLIQKENKKRRPSR